ncbi:mycothiol synthase [Glutamicibacter sp.]|uniref:mycothiol synthase n=1 Tax=Glutamicibacter sp. TaxID=1931995 RepID=UPI0028BD388E|nr:mycothiol synthase [Glutamicibacter sp.]
MSELPQNTVSLLKVLGELEQQTLAEVRKLATAAQDVDGNPPLSDQTLVALGTESADDSVISLLANSGQGADSRISGIIVAIRDEGTAQWVVELVVHPDHRGSGIGRMLLNQLGEDLDLTQILTWAHGDHEAARKLAESIGLSRVRELYRMRREGTDSLEEVPLQRGLTLRTFRVGEDETAWLEANAKAFEHHPEQGSMTLNDLDARMNENWFDPSGFFLAFDQEDQLLAFHWTKIHPASADSSRPMGEVYVVGVRPEAQGLGLGRALTITGINYLLEQGVDSVLLYVDADNEAAVKLYRSLGFTLWDADIMYGPERID